LKGLRYTWPEHGWHEHRIRRLILPFVFRLLLAGLALVVVSPLLRAQDAPVVYNPGDGVTLPAVVTSVRAAYTPEAMEAHIEGTVLLECVVRAEGTIADVRVARSLDSVYGLDTQAVNALKQWTFTPGTKDGKAVAVRVQISMKFALR
jgi:protein TonB